MYKVSNFMARMLIVIIGALVTNVVFAQNSGPMEEIVVWGQGRPVDESHRSSSTVILTAEDLVSINAMTTEDLVKYEPSLIIRQRYIGDPNGTMGMRTANMFQTARSSVYADGVPLHYFLQTAFNGSPRWALVGGNEVGSIEVISGPFSAEYGGNAMGGVINMETKIPTDRSFHFEGSMFLQDYKELGFNDTLNGGRLFGSYGDKFGNFSLYTSWIHLENISQPMDFRFSSEQTPDGTEEEVSGGIPGLDATRSQVINYADTGVQAANTDQFKVKMGYDFGEWFGLVNIAYEDRDTIRDAVNNYLLSTTTGDTVWNGNFVQDGVRFNINRSRLTEDLSFRQNLLLAGRLQGPITESWWLELNLSYYEMLKDQRLGSLQHPDDPTYTTAGRVRDYDNTGWKTADIKLETGEFLGRGDLELVIGYQFATYSMNLTDYDSDNYLRGLFGIKRNSSGGKTEIHSLFAQLGWDIHEQWDVVVGGRQEIWQSKNGFLHNFRINDLQDHTNRSENKFSPKFSIGYTPGNDWLFRYSIAKAYRFPIVEELFAYESNTVGTALADVSLKPEDGLHHNLMFERSIEDGNGYMRLNLIYETVENAIFSQNGTVDNVLIRTFLPVDEVTSKAAEMIYTQRHLLDGKLDARFNLTLMDSKITRNILNPSIEGNDFPRLPTWRGNLVLTYHITDDWDFGGGIRFASRGFQQLDNTDVASQVYGVMDKYMFVNLKTNYRINERVRISLALDNVFNEIAYVNHPYPQRTAFIEAALDF
ncbi:MAG: iron complex outermembrane receptor protein [Gammaproteobacteria bacterium]|jgi:iron complex outermembrane receptor protein